MSAFCALCSRDPDTGELFCVRLGEWRGSCPNFPDGYPWDAEREPRHGRRRTDAEASRRASGTGRAGSSAALA